jgi:hypothetical protein
MGGGRCREVVEEGVSTSEEVEEDEVDDGVVVEVEEDVVGEAAHDALGNEWAGVGVTVQDCLGFERLGHLKIPALVRASALARLQMAVDTAFEEGMLAAVVQKIRVLAVDAGDAAFAAAGDACAAKGDVAAAKEALQQWCDKRGCEVPFLQAFNLHALDTEAGRDIRALATCPRLAAAAAQLLGVDGVRLYQTSAFYKHPSHGETSWHTDLHTAPLDTNGMLTCWIALTQVDTDESSPLLFASKSHRDFALPYWYTVEGMTKNSGRKYPIVSHAPLTPGDATLHHGWTIHGAPPNFSGRTRKAFAISFVSNESRRFRNHGRRQRHDGEDLESYSHWLPHVRPGALIRHAAVPLVWRDPSSSSSSSSSSAPTAPVGEKESQGGGRKEKKKVRQVFEMARLEQPVYM